MDRQEENQENQNRAAPIPGCTLAEERRRLVNHVIYAYDRGHNGSHGNDPLPVLQIESPWGTHRDLETNQLTPNTPCLCPAVPGGRG